jgi:hypothetical protein
MVGFPREELTSTGTAAMNYFNQIAMPTPPQGNPLSLSERLIILALDADRAGFCVATEHLLYLASQLLDRPDSLRA